MEYLFIVSNVIFCCGVGIVNFFFTLSSIKRWAIFFHFFVTNDDKHTTFQLLATKGNNEVVSSRLAAFTEYGTQNAFPSYLGVLQPH